MYVRMYEPGAMPGFIFIDAAIDGHSKAKPSLGWTYSNGCSLDIDKRGGF